MLSGYVLKVSTSPSKVQIKFPVGRIWTSWLDNVHLTSCR